MAETPKIGAGWTERPGGREGAPASRKAELQAQRELAQRDYQTLKALFAQAPSPLLMMSGPEHRFTFINPPSMQLLRNRPIEALMDRPVREALPEMAGSGFFELLDEVYRSGMPFSGQEIAGRRTRLEAGWAGEDAGFGAFDGYQDGYQDGSQDGYGDGSPAGRAGSRSETAYFDFLYKPLRGPGGDVVGVMVQATDVTLLAKARLQAERREALLAKQWAEVEAIYRTAPVGLAVVDAVSLRFVRANHRQAELAGTRQEELIGQTVAEAFGAACDASFAGAGVLAGLESVFARAAAGVSVLGELVEGAERAGHGIGRGIGRGIGNGAAYGAAREAAREAARGVTLCWRVSASPVMDADGRRVQSIAVVMQDITAEKRIEAVLLETEKLAAVGRLASSIAHEINNPLESVMNLVYLARQCESIDEVKGYLEVADMELQRAASVTTQTLRFHKQLTHAQQVSCGELFAAALSVYQGRFANQRISVEKRKRAQESVLCLEGEIQQVLATLMSNAIDAMALGGRLLVRSRDGTDWRTGRRGLVLTVADSGTGMSVATQQRMFEAFFSTKGIGGSGLGLWVSKETIIRHDGRMVFRSSMGPVWRGTVFMLFLPHSAAERLRRG